MELTDIGTPSNWVNGVNFENSPFSNYRINLGLAQ